MPFESVLECHVPYANVISLYINFLHRFFKCSLFDYIRKFCSHDSVSVTGSPHCDIYYTEALLITTTSVFYQASSQFVERCQT